jgi:hypothetical protein
LAFYFPRGVYSLSLTKSVPELIAVKFLNKTETWPAHLEEHYGSEFKLSGFTDWIPELLEDASSFELLVFPKTKINY